MTKSRTKERSENARNEVCDFVAQSSFRKSRVHVRDREPKAEYRNQFIIEHKRFMESACIAHGSARVTQTTQSIQIYAPIGKYKPKLCLDRLNGFVHLMHMRRMAAENKWFGSSSRHFNLDRTTILPILHM